MLLKFLFYYHYISDITLIIDDYIEFTHVIDDRIETIILYPNNEIEHKD